jgi:hypothetical protein
MPNKRRRDKKHRSASAGRITATLGAADSVKELLRRSSPVLSSISDQARRQSRWRDWLADRLPATLATRVTGVVERGAELVIFTESASWGVRLRYAVAELESEVKQLSPSIGRISVRVLPKTQAHG